ncbi:MAG: right-handed parallel beta-helix repeat-containing protein, partial [Lachnospiraceae bacterium]|nr:right-handed parallel beta-helix repeat-containing protein [Lachnospiraceae bacterium]
VNTIDANTIKGCKGKGINIYNKSTVDTITANDISNCTEHGIIVGNSSKVTTVSGNTISSNGGTESAITAYEKGTIGTIEKNTIQNTSANAVGYSNSVFKITGSATVGNIIENTLVSTGDALVCASAVLMDNATVTGNIQDNELGSTESHAIKLTNKSTVGGNISSNTVHKVTAGCGLLMGSGAVIKGSISGNTFDNVYLKGIKITERSKVSGNIDSNILTTKEEGILIYQGTVTGKITGNKIVSQDRSIKITESQIGECKAEDNECSNEVYYR